MTRADIIQMLKGAWTRALMDEKDLREDIAESYSAWVQGLIQAAAPELSGAAQQQSGGQAQAQTQTQGGGQMQAQQPAAAEGAAM